MFASSPNPFPHFSLHHVKKPYPTSPKSTVSVHATSQTKNPTYLSTEMTSSASLYEVLGVPKSASGHEIKAAYRKLARVWHPDVVSMNQKETSAGEFMKIHAAYSTLSDPDKRANYDRDLCGSGRFYRSSSMSGFSGYSRKNWETDQCW